MRLPPSQNLGRSLVWFMGQARRAARDDQSNSAKFQTALLPIDESPTTIAGEDYLGARLFHNVFQIEQERLLKWTVSRRDKHAIDIQKYNLRWRSGHATQYGCPCIALEHWSAS